MIIVENFKLIYGGQKIIDDAPSPSMEVDHAVTKEKIPDFNVDQPMSSNSSMVTSLVLTCDDALGNLDLHSELGEDNIGSCDDTLHGTSFQSDANANVMKSVIEQDCDITFVFYNDFKLHDEEKFEQSLAGKKTSFVCSNFVSRTGLLFILDVNGNNDTVFSGLLEMEVEFDQC
jgi:hypothetical protein